VGKVRYEVSLLSDFDLFLFNEGNHFRIYEKLGAHPMKVDGEEGVFFAVWAPSAKGVWVMGDFNDWNKESHPLRPRGNSGIWEGFIPGVWKGCRYKYHILSHYGDWRGDKSDPVGFFFETPPGTASLVWDLEYEWHDSEWLKERHKRNAFSAPISIYEVHLGSFKRKNGQFMNYRELAHLLCDYVKWLGFTHVELLPIMEHPFYGSWGYQVTGYFAPTSRYGTPQDFMYFVDYLHQNGIGVILDWVPSHFPMDGHGLGFFDGTHLYEHADPRKGVHPDWNSFIFNYGRHEVRSFLISSAIFWLDKYHVDGLRVDAVASMLYLDFSRKPGEWIPNIYGGNENLEAIYFLRRLNEEVYRSFPDVQTIAEESTAWPMVTRPTYIGGLGFGFKWDMGWMHDTLKYFSYDPIYRKYHHDLLTFRLLYAFNENFILPLSHDEVVHGKGSLYQKMPGDKWQKLANLRLLYGYMYGQPGKKLLFMGQEFGQPYEWNHEEELPLYYLDEEGHRGVALWIRDLNKLLREEEALHELDFSWEGFQWVDFSDWEKSIVSFLRKGRNSMILCVYNFTPVPRFNYRIGVPTEGFWKELLNSDSPYYGGSGLGNLGGVWTERVPMHNFPFSLKLTLPPLSALFFKAP
jgi:1,4-alpha-glucan branching enzyme